MSGAIRSGSELALLFRRDLTRLAQEIAAFPDDETLWRVRPGVENSAGNLALHIEGNLREYVGRQLGNLPYSRVRELEFSQRGLSRSELNQRVLALSSLVSEVIEGLSPEELTRAFPESVLVAVVSTETFLVHLLGHLNYHLGQVDYLRRILTASGAIELAGL